jgi:DNA-binding response OmpR family regulator/anti-sigma regulatory factor (Ser/Thr protein kinase)
LQTIRKNSKSLLQLVTELMDFRKAESNNLKLHISAGNIVSFVHDIHASFQDHAATKHIHTDLVSPSSHIELYFDQEQLKKVLFNLLSNAFKFTPAGGSVNVIIEDNARTVEIRVVDNGKGIAPENLDKLFLNYYQENDYGVQNTGYGIGLALSKSIMELHKGRLDVESKAGVRTCFTMTLLKGRAHFSEDQLRPEKADSKVYPDSGGDDAQPDNARKDHERSSILLVEDNPELRQFIRDALEEHYQVMEAGNGAVGWECAIERIPDLIISDVMMPEMDGYTLCGKLKSDARTSHIPVILLTAKTSTLSHVNGLQMGADIYLTKPFSIHVLELHLRNLLESRDMMRQRFSREIKLEPKNIVIDRQEEEFLQKAIQYIEDNMEDPEFGVQALSVHMAMSQPVLYKKIKALTDMSVNDFIKSIRLKRAAQLLQQKVLTIYEVAYTVGYSDRKYFSKEFKKQFGKTPSEFVG